MKEIVIKYSRAVSLSIIPTVQSFRHSFPHTKEKKININTNKFIYFVKSYERDCINELNIIDYYTRFYKQNKKMFVFGSRNFDNDTSNCQLMIRGWTNYYNDDINMFLLLDRVSSNFKNKEIFNIIKEDKWYPSENFFYHIHNKTNINQIIDKNGKIDFS